MRQTAVLGMVAVALGCAGCNTKSGTQDAPAEVMLGQRELDKEATQKTNPLLAAVPGGITYEFNKDGTGASAIGGPSKKSIWKVVGTQGETLTIEVKTEGEPTVDTIE